MIFSRKVPRPPEEQKLRDHYKRTEREHSHASGICPIHLKSQCDAYKEARYYNIHVQHELAPPRFSVMRPA